MTSYRCKRCGYSATQVSQLRLHLQKKKLCNPVYCDESPEAILAELETVEGRRKNTTVEVIPLTQSSIKDLTKIGPLDKDNLIRDLYVELAKFKYENEMLKKQIRVMKVAVKSISKAESICVAMPTEGIANTNTTNTEGSHNNTTNTEGSHNNTNTNTNTNSHNEHSNNSTVHIQINNFGSENTSYLTPEFMQALMRNPSVGINDKIPQIVQHIHFNPDHPENHNVRPDEGGDEESVLVRRADAWRKASATRTIDRMLDRATERAAEAHRNDELFDEAASDVRRKIFEACVLKGMKNKGSDAKQLGRTCVRDFLK